jgi:hypothetical protein
MTTKGFVVSGRLFWVFFLENDVKKVRECMICICRRLKLRCANGLIENLRK